MDILGDLLIATLALNIIVFTLCSIAMLLCIMSKFIRRIFSFFISDDLDKSFKDIELLSNKELAKGIYSMMRDPIEILKISFMLYMINFIITELNLQSLFIF